MVFARQNLITDPPFSKLDLISCRNVLIYLQPEAQRKVISLFSFALNVGGYLFLGKSEAIADSESCSRPSPSPTASTAWRRPNRHAADLPVSRAARQDGRHRRGAGARRAVGRRTGRCSTSRCSWSTSAPRSCWSTPRAEILHFYGETEKYLGHPKGQASLNVFDMASGNAGHEAAPRDRPGPPGRTSLSRSSRCPLPGRDRRWST